VVREDKFQDRISVRLSKEDRLSQGREFAGRAYWGALKSLGITNATTKTYLQLYDWYQPRRQRTDSDSRSKPLGKD
jgi:hypothetical protein